MEADELLPVHLNVKLPIFVANTQNQMNMSKCNFSISFTGTPDEVYQKAKDAVEKQGGTFNGDSKSGNFSISVFGTISGNYSVSGNQLDIVIEDKLIMIPCAAIENVLKSQIA